VAWASSRARSAPFLARATQRARAAVRGAGDAESARGLSRDHIVVSLRRDHRGSTMRSNM